MGQTIELIAADGFHLAAYRCDPAGKPRGGIVIVQEIFGVNAHIRELADQYAATGYLAIAPAMFDRAAPGIELGYDQAGVDQGVQIRARIAPEKSLLDLQAAVALAASAGKVGVVGYCWGGTVAYVAAAHCKIAAAVSYYGGRITQYLKDKPQCPVMYHFGELDQMIPLTMIDEVRQAHPAGIFHIYQGADHGFNCDHRKNYEPKSAALARERSLAFLRAHVG